jgi:hypothetical protein
MHFRRLHGLSARRQILTLLLLNIARCFVTGEQTLRRRAEKSRRRTHLVRLCQLNLQTLVLVQQHAFLRVHRTVVQLVVLEEDLDERRPRGDGALDQRLRQRIFDVPLQGTPQRIKLGDHWTRSSRFRNLHNSLSDPHWLLLRSCLAHSHCSTFSPSRQVIGSTLMHLSISVPWDLIHRQSPSVTDPRISDLADELARG